MLRSGMWDDALLNDPLCCFHFGLSELVGFLGYRRKLGFLRLFDLSFRVFEPQLQLVLSQYEYTASFFVF